MIRNIEERDLDEIKRIHEKFYGKEFTFHDFLHNSGLNFLILDDSDDAVVTAISVRPLIEMLAVTNLDKSPRLRISALYDALQIAQHTMHGNQLHVFVQDKKWEGQLIRTGFKRTVGNALYINL